MSESPRTCRGPITLFCESRQCRWAAILLTLPVLYAASFVPAVWVGSRFLPRNSRALSVYCPLVWALDQLPEEFKSAIIVRTVTPALDQTKRNLIFSSGRIVFVDD